MKELLEYIEWLVRNYQLNEIEKQILIDMVKNKDINREVLKQKAIDFE